MSATSAVKRPSIPSPATLGVLISGRGSNLQALIDAVARGQLDARIALVISNKAEAGGLERARQAGIETLIVSHRDYTSRDEFDRALAGARIYRVHEVVETRHVVDMVDTIAGRRPPRRAIRGLA